MFGCLTKTSYTSIILALVVSNVSIANNNPSINTSSAGHLTIGIGYGSYSGDDWVAQLGYLNNTFLTNIGFNYESTKPNSGDEFSLIELRGELGLRKLCTPRLSFDYGLLASYGFRSKTSANRTHPYEAGTFVGLGYMLSPHLLIATKIAPYAYERAYNKGTHNRVFTEGSFSMSYVF